MKISHLWADLAHEHRLIARELASELVGRYWQSVHAGTVYSFFQWLKGQPEVDAATFEALERLVAEAPIDCLSCRHHGGVVEMRSEADDLQCPACGSTLLKRHRDEDSASHVVKLPKPQSATPPAQSLPISVVEGWGDSEPGRPELPERDAKSESGDASESDHPEGDPSESESDHQKQRLESVTTRRLAQPSAAARKQDSEPSGNTTVAHSTAHSPTERVHGLAQVGNWILEEAVGQGAIGVVFRARHHTLRRMAAIKVLKDPSQSLRKRFEREAQVYSDLDHPSIVRLYDYGEEQGKPYIVMEWIEGQSVTKFVETNGALAIAETIRLALQACSALRFAHELGIIHRDIKPDNLMITSTGKLKIADYGIAHVEDSRLTVQGAFLGTPHYMPPEQFKQESITPAADWYGLGATMVYMLTAQPPFVTTQSKSNVYKLLASKATTKLPSLRSQVSDIPRSLDILLAGLCAARPEQRPGGDQIEATLRALATTPEP